MEKRFKVYNSEESRTIQNLEKILLGFAKNYKLNNWIIPALIDGDTLRKCGYFKTMPNQLTVVGHFTEEACEAFNSDKEFFNEYGTFSDYYLTPAACIHLYPKIKNKNIRNELITTYARVYRYENNQYEEGKRLWDFGVREFVAVGTRDYVRGFLEDFKQKSLEYIQCLCSNVILKTANDHFYPSKENSIREKIQKANNLKSELIVNIDGKDLAIASFNYHGTHFSRAFEFDSNGKIVTGCVGFGLDRWVTFYNSCNQN